MKLSKLPIVTSKKGVNQTDRIPFITDESEKSAIPIGPRFQAEVPSWTGSFTKTRLATDLGRSKWLGRRVWPVKNIRQVTKTKVGRGCSHTCKCTFRGSAQCVRKHISEKRIQLQADLGPAFWKWKFDEMGEDVSSTWGFEEEKIFEWVLKANSTPQSGNFVNSAVEFLPCQSKWSILSYYLNVYIPRRISAQTRLSCTAADIDDELVDTPCVDIPRQIRVETRSICSAVEPLVKGSRKRIEVSSLTTYSRSPNSTSDGVFDSRKRLDCEGIIGTGFRGCLVDERVMFAARLET